MNITLRQLRAFVLTAERRSFSRAAEQLYITQSGISLMMRELEAQLGFRLFDRTTRRVTLTELGAKFLPVAQRSVLDLDASMATLGQAASEASHQLTVGVTPLMAADLLPQAVAEYQRANADVQIRLVDAERNQIIAMVEGGEIDIGLGVIMKSTPDVRRTPLFRFSLMAVGPRANDMLRIHRMTWKDVASRRLVGLPADGPIQQLVDSHLARAGRSNPPELVQNQLSTQIAMAETGAGFAILPTFAIPTCKRRKVTMYGLVDPVVDLDLFQIQNRGRKLSPHGQGFLAFLREYIARWAGRSRML